jgi:hypothetical protein
MLSSVIQGGDWHGCRQGLRIWLRSKSNRYSRKILGNLLAVKQPRVGMDKLSWFPMAISKHSFFLWLAVKGCLSTGDRLLKWGAKGETKCLFCRTCIESRDHLLFYCSFSRRL